MDDKVNIRSGKKKVNLPVRTYLLYLLIVTFLLTGVTFSKYITTSQGSDAGRVIGMGDLQLTETGDFYDIGNKKLMLTPGINLAKKAVVYYEGSEAACYVFVEVTASGWTTADNSTFSAENGKINWSVDDFWTYLELDGGSHIYYTVLASNQTITGKDIIKDGTVFVSDQLTNSKLTALTALSITFRATAVQLDGFGDYSTQDEHAHAAWASVKSR